MNNHLLSFYGYRNIHCMDSDLVFAEREMLRIGSFLSEMVKQGRMTPLEVQLVKEESREVSRQVGYLNSDDSIISVYDDDERSAVERQSNYLMRKKIIELRPELEEELTRAIAYRRAFPTPQMTPLLNRPGAALTEYFGLLQWIDEKRHSGELLRDHAYAAYEPAIRLFEDEGIDMGTLSIQTDKIVLVKAKQAIQDKLLELRPDLADEIRNLKAGRSK